MPCLCAGTVGIGQSNKVQGAKLLLPEKILIVTRGKYPVSLERYPCIKFKLKNNHNHNNNKQPNGNALLN